MKATAAQKDAGHRQRLRDRFLSAGLDGFRDYEIVELLLTLATPRKDCKPQAKAALKRFKTLQGVLDAPASSLCEIHGIGPTNVFGIKLVPAVANRYLKQRVIRKDPISNSEALFDHLYHSMRDKFRECFRVLFLDARNRILSSRTLFEGTLTASAVYPREVVAAALEQHAAALIFAHNHPSGDPSPSDDDVQITRKLLFACRLMGITVHEHLIIGQNQYFSFADHGEIALMNREFEKINPRP